MNSNMVTGTVADSVSTDGTYRRNGFAYPCVFTQRIVCLQL